MVKAELPLCVMTKCYLAKLTFLLDAMKNTIFSDYAHRPTSKPHLLVVLYGNRWRLTLEHDLPWLATTTQGPSYRNR